MKITIRPYELHKDKFNRYWPYLKSELCAICGQPDNCGNCNHKKLSLSDVIKLGGYKLFKS